MKYNDPLFTAQYHCFVCPDFVRRNSQCHNVSLPILLSEMTQLLLTGDDAKSKPPQTGNRNGDLRHAYWEQKVAE